MDDDTSVMPTFVEAAKRNVSPAAQDSDVE